jgi:hypothetical protein
VAKEIALKVAKEFANLTATKIAEEEIERISNKVADQLV